MPSYSPDVSLDTILAGVTAGTQSMLQGIVNGALQRQEIEIAKQKLKAYEKQVEAQEKAQDIAMKRLALEQAEAATALLQNQANLAGQPVTVPGQTIEALGLPPTKKVKKTVVTTEDIKTQQQEQLPITKGQLPQQPQKPVGETPYDRLLKKGIPKSVKAIFEQLLRSDTFKNLKKRGEIPADKRPIDLTPKELELWADTAKAPKGSKYNATYNFLKNLQKAKQQSEQQGTITKSYTEPHVEKETKIEEKVAEEPWKIYPQTTTGEPVIAQTFTEADYNSLKQNFPFVDISLMKTFAKDFPVSKANSYVDTLAKLNKHAENLLNKNIGTPMKVTDLNGILSSVRGIARDMAGYQSGFAKFAGNPEEVYEKVFKDKLRSVINNLKKNGASDWEIKYLSSYLNDTGDSLIISLWKEVYPKVKNYITSNGSITPEGQQIVLDYFNNHNFIYKSYAELMADIRRAKKYMKTGISAPTQMIREASPPRFNK